LARYGRRCPVQGAEEEREQVSKLSGKRTAVSKIPGEASISEHRRGKPVNGWRAISQVKRQGRPIASRPSLLLMGKNRKVQYREINDRTAKEDAP
jgi:hypothetical protein